MPPGSNGTGEGHAGTGCEQCGGRGWLVEPDGGAGRAQPCSCRSRDLVPRLLTQAGIPPRYAECTLANFTLHGAPHEREQRLKARETSRQYIEGFLRPNGEFSDRGLLFIGQPGVGKTHLAAAVLTELIKSHRLRARFVDFTSLIHRIQSTFDSSSPESKDAVLDPVTDAELLVLDELGAQKPTEWAREVLYLVINARYTRQLPTIFTTNYELEKDVSNSDAQGSAMKRHPLAERIGARLVSRLHEMARIVDIRAEDFRLDINKVHAHSI